MNYIKYKLWHVFYLLIRNIIKSIMLILTITFFFLAGSFEDTKESDFIINEYVDGGTHLYIRKYKSDNKYDYELLIKDEPIKLVNGYYNHNDYNDWNVAFWFLFSLTLIWTIIGFFINDDEDWEWGENMKLAITRMTSCELENDKYYYIAFGRLLAKSDNQYIGSNILYNTGVKKYTDILTCPKFETNTQKRENKLKDLGL